MGGFAAKIDELGKPGWIGLLIASFILWWPLGLVVLTYMMWSGRMACWSSRGEGHLERKFERMQERAKRWYGSGRPSSGNSAFDEYRDETLRRLEEEQREFHAFLKRLRQAKDKAEFDQFMAERRNPPASAS